MLDFSQTTIDKIVIHKIGNKAEGEGIQLSKSEITNLDDSTEDILLTYFLKSFKAEEFYRFNMANPFSEGTLLNSTQNIFSNESEFYVQSANIAERLYDVSDHPNIKSGELYIVYFNHILVDDEEVDAIGVFKSEKKDTFIRVYMQEDNYDVDYENGINIKKLDKGCLIMNVEADEGFLIKIVDATNKSSEAIYWTDDFIQAKVIEDNYFNTNTFMQMCKNFSENVLTTENNVDKNEQLGFMNKSYEYMKNNDVFEVSDFQKEVIRNPEVIEHFNEFKQDYEESYDLEPKTDFEISKEAVKKSKKYVKSVIKLDKNFHIYVHSKPEFIEQGFDETRQMKFYQLFYEVES